MAPVSVSAPAPAPAPAITIRRWEIYWVDLNPIVGSEQAGRRPVLVISNDEFNARMPIVTVLPLTTLEGKRRRVYPFEVQLPASSVTAGRTSIVMPYQVRTVSKLRLRDRVGRITDAGERDAIEARLLEHLEMS
jgi:mRNA interferase MazF